VVPRSTTEACCSCCTLSCIGLMYPSESSTSSALWCTTVWMAKHPSTWSTSTAHSLQSHLSSVSDPPADNFSTDRASYRLSSFARRAWLRDPAVSRNSFRKQLKTFLFETYYCIQHTRGSTIMRYTNSYYITLQYSSVLWMTTSLMQFGELNQRWNCLRRWLFIGRLRSGFSTAN